MANYNSDYTGAQIDSAISRANSTDVTAGTIAASKAVVVDSNKDITGFRHITATGTVTAANVSLTGNVDLGDASGDTVTITGSIDSNLIPATDDTYDIGSATYAWQDLFLEGDITFSDAGTLSTTAGDLTINAGSGEVVFGNENLTTTGTIDSGSQAVTGNVVASGTVSAEQLTTTDDLTVSGLATIGETLAVTGVVTAAGFTIGSAVINEAELETIDGITAGTVIASKAIVTDSNIDITGGRNITISGELDAATLDISGNADIDGTLEADAFTVDGTALNEYIADTVGAMVGSNTETNITVTYEDGDNTLDFVIGTLNQDTTGTSDNFTVSANNSTDETVYPVFVDGATGSQGAETDTGLTYNPSTGMLTSTGVTSTFTGNITGNVTGNTSGTAATVTTAAQTNITSLGTLTALTVDDVAVNGKVITMTGSASDTAVFTAGTNGTLSIVTTDDAAAAANIQITADGTVDIDSAGVLTLDSGAAINIEPASGSAILLDGTISVDAGVVTGATSITSTAFVGDVTGTSSKATVTDSTANTNFPVVFHNESDGLLDDTGALRYNPSTGELLVPKLTVAGTTTTADTVTMQAANAVIFEGATADEYETTLSIVDPTADRTQYLINQGGYIPLLAAATTTAITSTPAELNILDDATVTTAELNLIDGGTARGTDAVASGDGILINDAGTMKMTNVDTVSTYFASHNVGGGNIVTTGALNSGSITSGFGTIDTGSSTITTTGVITGGGFTIGSAVIAEAELEMIDGITAGTAAASKAVVLDGSKNIATIGTIGSGAITATGSSSFATSIKTPLIEYTDGDDAITIADGGGITAANGITSTAAANSFGATAFSGAVTTNSTIDGIDIATRDAILTSTTTTAGAALPKAGGTMTGNIVMADDTSIGIADDAERIEFDGAGDISVLGANFGVNINAPHSLVHIQASDASTSGQTYSHTTLKLEENDHTAFQISTPNNKIGFILFGTTGIDGATKGQIAYNHSIPNMYFATDGTTRLVLDNNSRISLSNNDSGTSNTIFGYAAGASLDAGSNYNVFIGHQVSDATMNDATYNVGIGYQALTDLTEGDMNICIGGVAGENITTGSQNILIGTSAGDGLIAETDNIAIGHDAMSHASPQADRAIAIGSGSLGGDLTSTADGTIGIGYSALAALTSGTTNTAVGYQTGLLCTTASDNTYIGHSVGVATHADDFATTAVGSGAYGGTHEGSVNQYNTAIGYNSMDAAMDGAVKNTAVGANSLSALTTGDNNTAVGSTALLSVTTGGNNVAVGNQAGDSITDGDENVIIGDGAAQTSTSAHYAVIIGRGAAQNGAISGNGTIAVGYKALEALTSGSGNTAVGYQCMDTLATGHHNTAIGYEALLNMNGADSHNTAVGRSALRLASISGDGNNVAVGSEAGDVITGGTKNTIIGAASDPGDAGAINQTAIGYGVTAVDTDNSVTIGNADVTAIHMAQDNGATVHCGSITIYGTGFAQGQFRFGLNNANYGIGDSSAAASGTATLYIGNAAITVSSDERIKRNIEDTKINATEILNKLRVVDFEWDDPSDKSYNNRNARVSQGGQWTGMIAQEMVEHVPHIINAPRKEETLEIDNESEDIWSVDFEHLVPTLVKAVQELSAKVEALENA